MSTPHEFDDLVRSKLAERRFEPWEEDWTAAERLIRRERSRSRGWIVPVSAGILLIGAVAFWSISGDQGRMNLVAKEDHANVSTAILEPSKPAYEAAAGTEVKHGGTGPSTEEVRGITTGPGEEASPTDRGTFRPSPANPTHSGTKPVHRPARPRTTHPSATTALTNPQADLATTTSTAGSVSRVALDAPAMKATDATDLGPITDPIPTDDRDPSGPVSSAIDVPEPLAPMDRTSLVTDPAAIPAPPTQPSDSAVIASATAAIQDSLPTTPILPPAIGTTVSPWEIGILAGVNVSRSSFTGGSSEQWKDGLKGERSVAFGGEAMWMRANFGIGTGLQYTSYQERVDVSEERMATTITRDSNYFVPVDTAFLYVLGNVVLNGETWFLTESRDTTINKLVTGTTTFTDVRTVRQALLSTNKVSYAEIPLLFDAHVKQGPWSIGIRGGPMIGLLTTRRGRLPNAELQGSDSYTDRTFRWVVLGATARAYVSYRFAPGWSIGAGPSWRAHFGDVLSGEPYERRNEAVGGQLMLSYRLP